MAGRCRINVTKNPEGEGSLVFYNPCTTSLSTAVGRAEEKGRIRSISIRLNGNGDPAGILKIRYFNEEDKTRELRKIRNKAKSRAIPTRPSGTRLFCQLPWNTTEAELFKDFRIFGPLDFIKIIRNIERQATCGYIQFINAKDALKALKGSKRTYRAIFADPPKTSKADQDKNQGYAKTLHSKCMLWVDCKTFEDHLITCQIQCQMRDHEGHLEKIRSVIQKPEGEEPRPIKDLIAGHKITINLVPITTAEFKSKTMCENKRAIKQTIDTRRDMGIYQNTYPVSLIKIKED